MPNEDEATEVELEPVVEPKETKSQIDPRFPVIKQELTHKINARKISP